MLIYVLAGVAAGEGISMISGHEYSPRIMKKVTQPTYEMLQEQYCVTLVSVTFFTSALCKIVIPRAQLYLLNRKGIITKCIQTSLSIVGTCTFSTTFVLATVVYIARRDAALAFLKGLKRLYDLLKDLESFISQSLSDPS